MEDEQPRFRTRATENDESGLAAEPVQASVPGGLAFEKIPDAVAAAVPALVAIADRMRPQEADADIGDFGLAALVAEHAGERVRFQLSRAHSLIAEGKERGALIAIEDALGADPESGEAWALKGQCLAGLGLHEAAVRVFRHSRQKISDPELRIAILKLEAECTQMATKSIEARVVHLASTRDYRHAIELVRAALEEQPSNVVFLHHLANLQWLSGDETAALSTIREAQRHAGPESADLIANLERMIGFGPHYSAVETARLSLRRGDVAGALTQLDSCQEALSANEYYEAFRIYAESKRRTLGQVIGMRGLSLPPARRQQAMRWLLSEELQAAQAALRSGDVDRARAQLESAARIEPECGAVLFMHARVLADQPGARPADRRQAVTLATRARVDPSVEEAAHALIQRIRRQERAK